VEMFTLYKTQVCQCGKLSQVGRPCKACGATNTQREPELAVSAEDLLKGLTQKELLDLVMRHSRKAVQR
jgi:hypothetical protein